jgi:hypothetical protein
MVTHMKTTIEIPKPLFEQAKRVAAREGTTLRAIIEAGLRRELRQRQAGSAFVLRDARVGGNGLQPEYQDAAWDKLRDAIYSGRGA